MFDVDFIVVVRNQLHFTKICIESILCHVPFSFHLIIVDNASSDNTPHYLNEAQNRIPHGSKLTILRSEKNLGYADGLNVGLRHSQSPYVLFCNNDIEFYPGSVEEMIRIAQKDPKFGLVNPNSNEFGLKSYDPGAASELRGQIIERCHTSGFCVLVKREVIQKIGGIDPEFGPAYFEDMDFAERAKKSGFLCVVAKGSYVQHFGTRTFLPAEKQALWDKNKRLFQKKWGGTKWFAFLGSSNLLRESEMIKNFVLKLARENIAVIYLFVPKEARPVFEGLHESFRIVEVPKGLEVLFFIGKKLSGSKKPISRVYVNEKQRNLLEKLKWFHKAEVAVLESTSS